MAPGTCRAGPSTARSRRGWLNPRLAGHLERAKVVTLFDLGERLNGTGALVGSGGRRGGGQGTKGFGLALSMSSAVFDHHDAPKLRDAAHSWH